MSAYPPGANRYPHAQLHPPNATASEQLAEQHTPIAYYTHSAPTYPTTPIEYHSGQANGHMEDGQNPARASSGGEGPKGNRLRKACDSCSIRKVKCDESGPPCRACAALDIPCTFERPSRRRGPPNRHAEAIKKRRLESPNATLFSSTSPDAAATLASFSSRSVLNAESICPLSTLELLVDDFFTYIHPLCPFPHEPSFRAAFKHREDLRNPSFLALLASMIGTLVASFPRKPRLHLKAQRREHLFPSSMSLVERCHKVAIEARGAGYLDKELSVYDAATSYFLGLAKAYTFQWRQSRLYFGETINITRVMGAHRADDSFGIDGLPQVFGVDGSSGGGENQAHSVDFIRQEIGRRVFWVMFVGIRSIQQLGATFSELLIPPPTPTEPYPPLPMEIDDEYIYVDHVDPQPPGVVSKLTGFNLGIQVYMTTTPLATMEMAYGIGEVFDFHRQKRVLGECLRAVKRALDSAPPELLLLPGNRPGELANQHERQYFPPNTGLSGAIPNGGTRQLNPEREDSRRKLQYEIQKANIYASQLGTRSYIVEKYWNLQEAYDQLQKEAREGSMLNSPGLMATGLDGMLPKSSATSNFDGLEANVAQEREDIVKDLLRVLGSISQVNMEPNAGSFINKIRQIASTLIDTPQNRKGPLAVKAEEYLGRFLDVLMKLERISPACRSDNGNLVEDEEEELRNWADLREYQMRFAQSGGF